MKISVIIPVYGVEKYIEKCISSIVNQTYKNLEIIIVNDGTKDNSIKIVEEKFKDDRIIILNKENGGLSSARNMGIDFAKGDYVYFLDGDDWLEKETFEILCNNLENQDIIYSHFFYYDEKKKKKKEHIFKFPFLVDEVKLGKYYLCNGEEINVWNKLYKLEFLKKFKFKFIENIIYEDQEFGFKTLLLAKDVKYISKPLYNYRINREGSIMNSLKKEKELFSIGKIYDELKTFFSNIELDDFQKARLELNLLSLEIWKKEILNEKVCWNIKSIDEKIKKIYNKNNNTNLERKVLKIIIKGILRKKSMRKIEIVDLFYLKNGLISFKIIKNRWKI